MGNSFWKHGQQTEIAMLAHISTAHLSDILHRRRGVSVERARRLERTSGKILGTRIPWEVWVTNKFTKHPAFMGEPVKETKEQDEKE